MRELPGAAWRAVKHRPLGRYQSLDGVEIRGGNESYQDYILHDCD